PDLFARVLVSAVERLLKRGPDRGYVPVAADTRSPRGKIAVADTLKRNLMRLPAAHCAADELRHDVPHNRVLKAMLGRLARCRELAPGLRESAAGLYHRFHDVTDIALTAAVFERLQLHRSARHY